jgi:predicted anti-sigma-YlaC factor YlaD
MINEMIHKTDCKTCRSHLPDLLFEEGFAAAHPELESHMESCAECRTELNELRSTFALLDEFTAPEPSPYFDSKLHARLREAQDTAPEGFIERLRSFVLFSTGRSFRPALTGALGLLLLLGGGGTFVGLYNNHGVTPAAASSSATVNDLKVLDNNVQAEQQMGQLLDMSGSEDDDTPPAT